MLRGLERDRDRRWQSLDDLRRRPARPAAGQPAAGPPAGAGAGVPGRRDHPAVRRRAGRTAPPVGAAGVPATSPSSCSRRAGLTLGLAVVYFALFEGLFGWTPGKWLLRLRVSRVGETGPPGLGRAPRPGGRVRRHLGADRLRCRTGWSRGSGGRSGCSWPSTGAAVGVGLLLCQLWPQRTGWYRGLHDFASGCRVTQRPRPAHRVRLVSRYPNPLDRPQPTAEPLPASVGGFAVRAKVCDLPDGGEVWSAEDKALGRRVLVRVWPPNTGDPLGAEAAPGCRRLRPLERLVRRLREDSIARPTRLRAVGHGTAGVEGDRARLGRVRGPGRRPAGGRGGPGPAAHVGGRPAAAGAARRRAGRRRGGRLRRLAADASSRCGSSRAGGSSCSTSRCRPAERRGRGRRETEPGSGPRRPGFTSPLPQPAGLRPRGGGADPGGQAAGRRAAGCGRRSRRTPRRSPTGCSTDGYRTLNQLRADLDESHAHPPAVTAGRPGRPPGGAGGHAGVRAGVHVRARPDCSACSWRSSAKLPGPRAGGASGDDRDPADREALLAGSGRAMPAERADAREQLERALLRRGGRADPRPAGRPDRPPAGRGGAAAAST